MVLGASVEQVPELVKEQKHALETSPELNRIVGQAYRMTRGRSFFETITERAMNLFGFTDESDYDYGSGGDYFYGGPEVFGNNPSSYAFYNPYENYHPARQDEGSDEDAYGMFDFAADVAMIGIPLIIGAMMVPTSIIPVVGRSLDNNHIEDTLQPFELPLLRAVESADFLSYTTRDCQARIFCEVSKIGRNKESSLTQKLVYLMANLTPDHLSEGYGMKKLFKASRDGMCEIYKCVPLMTPGGIFERISYKALPQKKTTE